MFLCIVQAIRIVGELNKAMGDDGNMKVLCIIKFYNEYRGANL